MLNRRGVTLIEMLVTTVIGGIALALVAGASLRQQRVLADLADAGANAAQLRDAAAILPIDLRSVASASGDIRQALDTALEIRATIASAVVCDTASGVFILAPSENGAAAYAGYVAPLEAGDTAWVLSLEDTAEHWTPRTIATTANTAPGTCAALGPTLGDTGRMMRRIALSFGEVLAAPAGTVLRVTRPVRYSLYHAGDGGWYVGERDWNPGLARFNTIQPVSGPFLPATAGGLTFRYLDSAASMLPTPVADVALIDAIHVDLKAQTKSAPRALAAATTSGPHRDSASVWIFLRNRK